jgi:Fur family ferric uptake transcriptional regulator
LHTPGVYKTKQRERIWEYLCAHRDTHVDAEAIVEHLRRQGTAVGKSTVYRTLDRLVAEGVLRRFYLEEGMSACYQLIPEDGRCREHFHLKCLCCGRLLHMECGLWEEVQAHIYKEHRFLIDHTKTVFYGLCEGCSQKQEEAER